LEIHFEKVQGIIFGLVLLTSRLTGYSSSSTSTTTNYTYSAFAILALFLVIIAVVVFSPRGTSRMRGVILGLLILVTIFVVPFGTADTSTLYAKAASYISNLGTIQSIYTSADQTYAYIFISAFIILVIAGAVGLFPLGAGFLGIVGMAMITIAPYVIYPNGPTTLDPGLGFYTIWVASIASVGVSFRRRKKPSLPASATPMPTTSSTTETVEGGMPKPQLKCSNCGAMNAADAVQCSNCGMQLMKGT
jgi:hypothetical protein